MKRAVLKYTRQGPVCYLSHLDMQRLMGRALRRAGIEVEYSHGFNPHIVMSFASPLSVGYATEGDYLEISVEDDCDVSAIAARLNAVLPRDVRMAQSFAWPHKQKLMAANHSAKYLISFALENEGEYGKIEAALENILRAETYNVPDRKGREVDLGLLVLDAGIVGNSIWAVLKNSSTAALNPAVLANVLLAAAKVEGTYEIGRLDCFAEIGGEVAAFSAFGAV